MYKNEEHPRIYNETNIENIHIFILLNDLCLLFFIIRYIPKITDIKLNIVNTNAIILNTFFTKKSVCVPIMKNTKNVNSVNKLIHKIIIPFFFLFFITNHHFIFIS